MKIKLSKIYHEANTPISTDHNLAKFLGLYTILYTEQWPVDKPKNARYVSRIGDKCPLIWSITNNIGISVETGVIMLLSSSA